MFIGSHNLLLYDTTEEFNVDLKAECDQLNLANIIRNKKNIKMRKLKHPTSSGILHANMESIPQKR